MGAGPVGSFVEDAAALVSRIFDEAERRDPGHRLALHTTGAPCLGGTTPRLRVNQALDAANWS